mgnify:CR=1 FL=1
MQTKLIIAAASLLLTATASAEVKDRKAEEMCTGQKTTEDYPRWSLITGDCKDANVSVCKIERKDGLQAEYICMPEDRPSDDDGDGDASSSGGGGRSKPTHQY